MAPVGVAARTFDRMSSIAGTVTASELDDNLAKLLNEMREEAAAQRGAVDTAVSIIEQAHLAGWPVDLRALADMLHDIERSIRDDASGLPQRFRPVLDVIRHVPGAGTILDRHLAAIGAILQGYADALARAAEIVDRLADLPRSPVDMEEAIELHWAALREIFGDVSIGHASISAPEGVLICRIPVEIEEALYRDADEVVRREMAVLDRVADEAPHLPGAFALDIGPRLRAA